MNWLYEDKEFTDVEDYYGFIYLTKAGYKTVKGKRKKIRLESDWRDYYGSSTSLKEDVDHYGKDSFRRTILRLCKSRGECNYFETKYIFDTDAILDPQYYNNWVSCKIQASHVKALIFNPEQENL